MQTKRKGAMKKMDVNYASNAKGNLGVTLGAVGTGLALADGGANLIGKLLGGGVGGSSDPGDKPVTRYHSSRQPRIVWCAVVC